MEDIEVLLPNFLSLVAAKPTSCNASPKVYGLSLFALRRGLNMRSRNDRRVCSAPTSRTEDMVTGSVELLPIWFPLADALN